MQATSSNSLKIDVFGPFTARVNNRPLTKKRSEKELHLLAFLTLHAGRTVERKLIIERFWPETPHDKALGYLCKDLSHLRTILDTAAGRITAPSKSTLCFELEETEANILVFDRLAQSQSLSAQQSLLSFPVSSLLEGWDEDWVLEQRRRRKKHCLDALRRLVAHEDKQGNLETVRRYLKALASMDVLEEAVWLRLMENLMARQDYTLAAAVFEDLKQQGTPSEQARKLYHKLPASIRLGATPRTKEIVVVSPASNEFEAAIAVALRDNLRPSILESEGLIRYLAQEGRLVAMRNWLKGYLQSSGHPLSVTAAPYAWKTLARWCIATRDFAFAEHALIQARRLFSPIPNTQAEMATCLGTEAHLAWQRGDYVHHLACNLEALALWRALDNAEHIADTLRAVGDGYTQTGAYAQARASVEEALALHEKLGDRRNVAHDYTALGFLVAKTGDYPQARTYYEQARQTALLAQDQEMAVYLSYRAALDALEHKDFPTAEEIIQQFLAFHCDRKHLVNVESGLGPAIRWEAEAGGLYESDAPGRQRGARRIARLWGIKQRIRAQMGLPPTDEHDCPHMLAAADLARRELGETVFSEAEAKGRAMGWEEIAAYVGDRRRY